MRITNRQLRRIIKEEKLSLLEEDEQMELDLGSKEPDDVRVFKQVGGDKPVFHDAAMDAALNDYVMQYVWRLEEDIGESRGTLALLESMKGYLIDSLEDGVQTALAANGVDY